MGQVTTENKRGLGCQEEPRPSGDAVLVGIRLSAPNDAHTLSAPVRVH
jgi:hypothetical protein